MSECVCVCVCVGGGVGRGGYEGRKGLWKCVNSCTKIKHTVNANWSPVFFLFVSLLLNSRRSAVVHDQKIAPFKKALFFLPHNCHVS